MSSKRLDTSFRAINFDRQLTLWAVRMCSEPKSIWERQSMMGMDKQFCTKATDDIISANCLGWISRSLPTVLAMLASEQLYGLLIEFRGSDKWFSSMGLAQQLRTDLCDDLALAGYSFNIFSTKIVSLWKRSIAETRERNANSLEFLMVFRCTRKRSGCQTEGYSVGILQWLAHQFPSWHICWWRVFFLFISSQLLLMSEKRAKGGECVCF